MRWMWLIILLPFVTACGTVTTREHISCPPLKKYTPEETRRVAQEMDAAGNSFWPQMIVDYGTLRAECRE